MTEREQERAAIVAWLRAFVPDSRGRSLAHWYADQIETGDHLRNGGGEG